ncbi:uncharacterized protein LOC144100301 [Amblyomma americanum]
MTEAEDLPRARTLGQPVVEAVGASCVWSIIITEVKATAAFRPAAPALPALRQQSDSSWEARWLKGPSACSPNNEAATTVWKAVVMWVDGSGVSRPRHRLQRKPVAITEVHHSCV